MNNRMSQSNGLLRFVAEDKRREILRKWEDCIGDAFEAVGEMRASIRDLDEEVKFILDGDSYGLPGY